MRIGIDARALALPPAGIAVYTRSLLREFVSLDSSHSYYLYSTKPFQLPFGGPVIQRIGTGPWARKGSAWMQMSVPDQCRRDRIDLFWSPLQTLPVALPRSIRAVLTVHDFVQIHHPGSMKFGNWLLLKTLAPPSWRRADAFITGSEHVAAGLRSRSGRERSIRVIPHGPMAVAGRPTREEALQWVAARFGVTGRYILAVGTIEPRKNLATLIGALGRLDRREGETPHLILAGSAGWKAKGIHEAVRKSGLGHRIVFTGTVSDEDLTRLYAGATLFVYPSWYEGFGIPVLEAMAMGVPVIASRSSSLPEVVGDAGILFDPRDEEALGRAMGKLLKEQALRGAFAAKGMVRASMFGWKRAASETLELFEETLGGRVSPSPAPLTEDSAGGEAGHFDRRSLSFLRAASTENMKVSEPTSWETSIVKDAFTHLGELKGFTFLDFGCGHGHNAIYAGLEGARPSVGFDLSLESIRVASMKARASGAQDRAFFVVARADRLPFRKGAFDRIVGTGILHHVDLEGATGEARRVLSVGVGRAAFTEPLDGNPAVKVVRSCFSYPRKARTPWERPLRRRDVEKVLGIFPHSEAREYYMFSGLLRAVKGYFTTGPIDRLDRALMNLHPLFRRLAAQVLLLLKG
ncbi:MAG: glycosyltransferase [Planctomycetota bacterium]|jgi:glycosyltransferase involved in cell wall biosynthesis/ubiquinone/menaquinone biosynthesis C-methylase UbiE